MSSREEYIKKFERLLNEYSDELPQEIIHNQGKYKCRAVWFQIIYGTIEGLIIKGLANNQVEEWYKGFVEYMDKKSSIKSVGKTSREDIERGNNLLRLVIKNIQEGVK